MVDFKSKKINILSYFLVSFIASFFAPATYDNAILAITEKIGYFVGWLFWGLSISAIIFLIRLIGNRSNKFDYFMNILWCSTLASIIIGTAGVLWKSASYSGSVMPHIFTALAYNIVTIVVAAFLFYKRKQDISNKETPISVEAQTDINSQTNKANLEQTEAPRNSVDVSSSTQTEKEVVDNPHYFYAQGTNPVGPLSLEELILSNIEAETLVWKTGMKYWEPAKCFLELQSHIDITTGHDEQESSQEIHVKPNEDQTLNDRAEQDKETSEKNVDESFMEDLSYYYAEGTSPVGPLSLKALVQTNLNSDTLIWKVGMKNWKPARCFPEIQSYIKKEFTLDE